jgi:Mn-dependent DtxR family transcriptional regulator
MNRGKNVTGKGEICPRTCHEDPEGEEKYKSTYIVHIYIYTYLLTYLLTPWSRVVLEKLTGPQIVKKLSAFMEPEGSSPHSQVPATCPYLKYQSRSEAFCVNVA